MTFDVNISKKAKKKKIKKIKPKKDVFNTTMYANQHK